MIFSISRCLMYCMIPMGILLGGYRAEAAPRTPPSLRAMETACLKNASEPRTKRWSGSCFCVANTLWRDLRWEPRAKAEQEIKWAESLFAETMTSEEFARDPYNLVETLDGILDQCNQPPKRTGTRAEP